MDFILFNLAAEDNLADEATAAPRNREPETMNPFTADDERLRALILHLSARCSDWKIFDVILLDRMLFQSDFLHFRLHGFPITGHAYHRGIRSPAPQTMRRLTRAMIRSGELEITEVSRGDGLHVRFVPTALRDPDLRIFDGQEIAVVERVLWFYRNNWTSNGIADDVTVDGPDLLDLPWELAGPQEEIPYHLALISGPRTGKEPEQPQRLMVPQPEEMIQIAHHTLIVAD